MKKLLACMIAVSSVTLISQQVVAQEDNDISGSLGGGFMIIDSANNLNPESSNKWLDSLDSAPSRQTTFVPVILPEVTWDIGKTDGAKVYFKIDPPIDEVGSLALNLGSSYEVGNLGIIDTSVFVTPFAEVWEDPFLVGEAREETDLNIYGVTLGLNRIMGSGLRVQLVYMATDVDDDLIGERISQLSRDGAIYSLKMNYSFNVNPNVEIRPTMSIRKGDYDGDANSFIKYKFQLESRLRFGKMFVMPRVFYSYSEYDEMHPIFNKIRDNNAYGASLAATYIAPFDLQDWSLTGLVSVSRGESNIDFYDTEATTVGAIVTYRF
ncbi:DUF2860 family protein [Desulfogranum japonicum]|uniref:DUF2860 family protein n=1 Tax=Desulfogranum japonicum TaxID=231447 RepID=UPI00040833D2|nr:DUF2860 family protein [Desulfogranum japonicum]